MNVRIYNRAGRIVRKLADGISLRSGENVLYWDGRQDDSQRVPDGIFVISVTQAGTRLSQTRTVAVVH